LTGGGGKGRVREKKSSRQAEPFRYRVQVGGETGQRGTKTANTAQMGVQGGPDLTKEVHRRRSGERGNLALVEVEEGRVQPRDQHEG